MKSWKKMLVAGVISLMATGVFAQQNVIGQTIQITTRLNSFVGHPIWTLIIRDVDSGIVYPYLYDFSQTNNFWLAFTYGRNFLITASRLQIQTYQPRYNKFRNYRIKNFCQLESNGHIMRNLNMFVNITGDLSQYDTTYTCHVATFPQY